jgi:hypothetical protein
MGMPSSSLPAACLSSLSLLVLFEVEGDIEIEGEGKEDEDVAAFGVEKEEGEEKVGGSLAEVEFGFCFS